MYTYFYAKNKSKKEEEKKGEEKTDLPRKIEKNFSREKYRLLRGLCVTFCDSRE